MFIIGVLQQNKSDSITLLHKKRLDFRRWPNEINRENIEKKMNVNGAKKKKTNEKKIKSAFCRHARQCVRVNKEREKKSVTENGNQSEYADSD